MSLPDGFCERRVMRKVSAFLYTVLVLALALFALHTLMSVRGEVAAAQRELIALRAEAAELRENAEKTGAAAPQLRDDRKTR